MRLDPLGRRRRPALAVGSLALVVACVAVFVSVYLKAGDERSVLAVARAVPQGGILTANDLTVVRISTSSGIATLPAAAATVVMGRRAVEPLEPNTLLSTNELVTRYSPPAGESIVGVAVKGGQIPASGVAPGESVDVVLTGLPGAPDSAATAGTAPAAVQQAGSGDTGASGPESDVPGTVLVSNAQVVQVAVSPSSSGTDGAVVSLMTSVATAPAVAAASAAEQVALVVVGPTQ